MHFVTIPFDYEELPEPARAAVIPICIARNDQVGTPIAWGWFEAVARIPDRMLALARRYLCDPWRASELSEEAVHKVWDLHGDNFGRHLAQRQQVDAGDAAQAVRQQDNLF